MRSAIQLLPPRLINQIAAGECIERPSSVVKELVENSLDAGATRIEVHVEDAGLRSIRVVDDGCGIPADELPLAFASHATSKLVSVDDLSDIRTLGFRGEALASMASVARVAISSATESGGGHILESCGGQLSEVRPAGMARGTTVEVRDLFFNIPARRKFLKSKNAEMGHIVESVFRLALSAFPVGFRLARDQRTVFSAAPAKSPSERISELLENSEFLQVSDSQGPHSLCAHLAKPSHHKASAKVQYFFINGRHVKDRMMTRALENAYLDHLPTQRHPIAVVYLQIDPSWVDVNVHPAKVEVRFRDSQEIFRLIYRAASNALRGQSLGQGISDSNLPKWPVPAAVQVPVDVGGSGKQKERRSDLAGRLPLFAPPVSQRPLQNSGIGEENRVPTGAPSDFVAESKSKLDVRDKEVFESQAGGGECRESEGFRSEQDREAGEERGEETDAKSTGAKWAENPRSLQVLDSYLVVEVEDGILVIDQHALHEKILFERFRSRLHSSRIVSQELLFPETISLSSEETAAFEQWEERLRSIGIVAEKAGLNRISVRALPEILGRPLAIRLVSDLLEQLARTEEISMGEAFEDSLARMACKAAVKAGEKLSPEEIVGLLRAGELADDPFHCPHGRPTAWKITRKELEARFLRR